ncbi:hypothetical protein [Desulfohalovibrio reitneri]|uniref:hypothetical protein n=1 Tax=Desulfohalovibrio reitneri TaxID=1307759 RepID=UPI0013786A14|nr:hypothetical protein [Desulfohalovibrio reitneri]
MSTWMPYALAALALVAILLILKRLTLPRRPKPTNLGDRFDEYKTHELRQRSQYHDIVK